MKKYLLVAGLFTLLSGVVFKEAALAQNDRPWGVGVRAGTWGIPSGILDMFLDEHPSVDGETFGVELRQYGEDGTEGVFSVSYAFDLGRMDGTGVWLLEDDDPAEDLRVGKATLDVYALTVTFLWDIMPEWIVHPYLGLGVGLAYVDGKIPPGEEDDDDAYTGPAPAVNIPVGLRAQITENLSLSLEARFFTGGLALGGGALYAC